MWPNHRSAVAKLRTAGKLGWTPSSVVHPGHKLKSNLLDLDRKTKTKIRKDTQQCNAPCVEEETMSWVPFTIPQSVCYFLREVVKKIGIF